MAALNQTFSRQGVNKFNVASAAQFLAFVILYYFAYRYGMSFGLKAASPFWFPDAILLCALLKTNPAHWWLILLTALPIRFFPEVARDVPLWMLWDTYLIDCTKGVFAALALRHYIADPLRLETIRDFAIFALIAVLLVPAASAFLGAAVRAHFGDPYWVGWQQWFMGDALAQLIIAPALICLMRDWPSSGQRLSRKGWIEAGLTLGGLVVTGYLASHSGLPSTLLAEPRYYAPILFVFWMAIRFGMLGASVALSVVSLIFAEAAAEGHGPFVAGSPTEVASALQGFLFARSIALYAVALSIDQMRRAQETLRESENRFRTAANGAPIMMWMSGLDKRCDFFNDGWLNFTGRPLEAELGDGWAEGVHNGDLTHCLETYETAFDARRPFEMEYRLRRNDGEYRWVFDAGVPRYAPNGDFVGYIGVAIDVSERRHTEELGRSLAHLQRVSVLGQLSAAIAHEVVGPMNAMLLNTYAAEKLLDRASARSSELREIILDIREDILRATEVIKRTQDLARKHESQKEPLDLNATLLNVLRLVASEASKNSVRIRTELEPAVPLVIGNQTQLQQVVLNLVLNGLEAMKDTPIPARELTIRSKLSAPDLAEILIVDRGCGIATADLPDAFEPFFTTKEKGLGLGLVVSRTIVEAHNGRIWLENNANGGLSVHFTLQTLEAANAAQSEGPLDVTAL